MADSHNESKTPILPDANECMEANFVAAPHPSVIEQDALIAQCELRTQRRSGPGGQHRNKTSTGAFLTHRLTGVVGEATESRSQSDNRRIALLRLRYRLAIEIRTPAIFETEPNAQEQQVRAQYTGHSMKLAETNSAKPALLALLLNDLHAAGGQPSAVSPKWQVSTSKLIGLLKSHPPAMVLVNRIRRHHGRRDLK